MTDKASVTMGDSDTADLVRYRKARKKVVMEMENLNTIGLIQQTYIKNSTPSKDRIHILFKHKKNINKKWPSLQRSFKYLIIFHRQYYMTTMQ